MKKVSSLIVLTCFVGIGQAYAFPEKFCGSMVDGKINGVEMVGTSVESVAEIDLAREESCVCATGLIQGGIRMVNPYLSTCASGSKFSFEIKPTSTPARGPNGDYTLKVACADKDIKVSVFRGPFGFDHVISYEDETNHFVIKANRHSSGNNDGFKGILPIGEGRPVLITSSYDKHPLERNYIAEIQLNQLQTQKLICRN